jgi:WD40 repeat protein
VEAQYDVLSRSGWGFFPPSDLLGSVAALRLDMTLSSYVAPSTLSADGQLLALISPSPSLVWVWDTKSGRMQPLPPAPPPITPSPVPTYNPVRTVLGFSPKGDRIAVGYSDGTVVVWDLDREGTRDARCRARWEGILRGVGSATFSPDGELLQVVDGTGNVVVRSLADKNRKTVLVHSVLPVLDLAYSGDGNRIATVDSSGTIRVWDPKAKFVQEISGDAPSYSPLGTRTRTNSIALDATGERVAIIALDDSVSVTEVTTRKVLLQLPPASPMDNPSRNTYSIALSPDGKWLATGTNHVHHPWIGVYEVDASPKPRLRGRLEHEDNVYHVAFSADGRWLASASADKSARIWKVGEWDSAPVELLGHTGNVTYVAFDPTQPTEYLGTIGADKTLRVWKFTEAESQSGKFQLRKQVFSDSFADVTPSVLQLGSRHRAALLMNGPFAGIYESRIATYHFDAVNTGALIDLAQKRLSRPLQGDEQKYLNGRVPSSKAFQGREPISLMRVMRSDVA